MKEGGTAEITSTEDEIVAAQEDESVHEISTKNFETKLIKIKLKDPAKDEATEDPIFVTMEIVVPVSQEPSWRISDTNIGMGQTIQMTVTDNDIGHQAGTNKRVEIRQDEIDRERIREETDKILSEVIEELSPDDIIQRKNHNKDLETRSSSVERKNNRPIRRRSSLESVSSPESVTYERIGDRPTITRRRSSIELSTEERTRDRPPMRRWSSLADMTPERRKSSRSPHTKRLPKEEVKKNRPIRRRSTVEIEADASASDASSVSSAQKKRKKKRQLLYRRRSSQDILARRRDRPSSRKRGTSVELPRRRASGEQQSLASSVDSLPTPEKGLEPFKIPTLITSAIEKSDPNQKVGLAFRKSGSANTVIIDKIMPGSPFIDSNVEAGNEMLFINGQRVHSARGAAEIVRESRDSLTLVVSNAVRPPGAMYSIVSIGDYASSSSLGRKNNSVAGTHFKMKNGLVQIMKIDDDSPVASTSMRVGDFILAVNGEVAGSIFKVVDAFVDSSKDEFIPVLYLNMRNLRASLVDTNVGDQWQTEWSDYYDECRILSEGSTPLLLQFKEDGRCELVDPELKKEGRSAAVSPGNPLHSIVEAINHGIICLLSAIREGVSLASFTNEIKRGLDMAKSSNNRRNTAASTNVRNHSMTPGTIMKEEVKRRGSDQLAEMLVAGLLDEEDFKAIKAVD